MLGSDTDRLSGVGSTCARAATFADDVIGKEDLAGFDINFNRNI